MISKRDSKEKNIGIDRSERQIKSLKDAEFLKEGIIDLNLRLNFIEKIESLPKTLMFLDFSYNKISSTKGLSHLKNLAKLNLSHNNLSRIELLDLPNLQEFDLSSNSLKNLMGIDRCRNLKKVIVTNNALNQLTKFISAVKVKFLKY